jgi:GTP-binding protein HflX
VLDEIGAKEVPRLLVFNKIDRGGDERRCEKVPGCVVMSARRPGDVARLREADRRVLPERLVEAELFLPWSAQKLRGEIFASCQGAGGARRRRGRLPARARRRRGR